MRSTIPKLSRSLPNPINLKNTQKSHAQLIKSRHSIAETCSLIQSYLTSGSLSSAVNLFDEMPQWDLVSTTFIITSLTHHDHHHKAIQLFSRLPYLGVTPNQFTFGIVISASTALRDLELAKQLHALATKFCLVNDVFVGSSLLDCYVKLSSIEDAQRVFSTIHEPNVVSYTTLLGGLLKNRKFNDAFGLFRGMPETNVVSWNTMVAGCSRTGLSEEAVCLFVEMMREGLFPTQLTFPSVFAAVSNLAALGLGRSIHASCIKLLNDANVYVCSSLISFYAKCGCLEDSLIVYHGLRHKNIVSWNSLICGYALNGNGREALNLYRNMQNSIIKPNGVTLLVVLFGCNHAGLVEEGYTCFMEAKANDPGILTAEHYACVVNLLSRSGRFSDAEMFLSEVPFDPGIGFWTAFLAGCQVHCNDELAVDIARKIEETKPRNVSTYVMLSNVYSAAGNWQKALVLREEMKERDMGLIPGCSWIEIGSKMHVFCNGDQRHSRTDDIYRALSWILIDFYKLDYRTSKF